MKTIFRADGNKEIGLGHIVRCLALAYGLKERSLSAEIIFVTKYEEGHRIIEDKGFQVLKAERDELSQIKRLSTDGALLITDFLDTDNAYISKFRTFAGLKIVSIDNNTKLKNIDADVVVNANVFDEDEIKVIGSTKYFLGPKYMILRKGFDNAALQTRVILDKVSRILVMSGGSDSTEDSLILKCVSALDKISEEVQIDLICGPAFPFMSELRKLLSVDRGKFEVYVNPSDLVEIMNGSDMAITAAGIVLYELATLGVPSITVPQVNPNTNHQEDIAIAFAASGACINLGRNPSIDLLRRESMMLINDKLRRKKLSENAKSFIDGKGLERILQLIGSTVLEPN